MPLPKPKKGESQDDFMARCMHEAYGSDAPDDRTQEQAVAMCMDAWRNKDKAMTNEEKRAQRRAQVEAIMARMRAKWPSGTTSKDIFDEIDFPEPEVGENREDYVDRCIDEVMDSQEASDEYDEGQLADGCEATAEAFDWDENDERVEDSYTPAQRLARLRKRMAKAALDEADLPEPEADESKDDFISRCMTEVAAEFDDLPDDIIEEACEQVWEEAGQDDIPDEEKARVKAKRQKQDDTELTAEDCVSPDPGEDHADFIDRCMEDLAQEDADFSEDEMQNACEDAWELFGGSEDEASHKPARVKQPKGVTHFKTHAEEV